jgi:hypothetical protein
LNSHAGNYIPTFESNNGLFASLFTATCFIEGRVFCFGYVVNTGHDGHGFRLQFANPSTNKCTSIATAAIFGTVEINSVTEVGEP